MASRVVTVKQKGQITLPADLRRKYKLDEGSKIIMEDLDGRIVLVRPEDVVSRTAGIFKEYAKNLPLLEPHQIRELTAQYIAEEVLQSLKDEADGAK
jgi:AbrB family looped-hinge helix DNA binding protein